MKKIYFLFILTGILIIVFIVTCKKKEENPVTIISCIDRANFGDPVKSEYILPYTIGKGYYLSQSYCNPNGGHKNQLAYDFAMKIGDSICAARSGIVMEIKEDLPDTGNENDPSAHNHIFVLHNDGTVGFYAHLMQEQVFVNMNDTINQGQIIALSGNSGNTGSFPHLHFGVYQNWPAVEGFDVPVNFKNTDGILDDRGGLVKDLFYMAKPY